MSLSSLLPFLQTQLTRYGLTSILILVNIGNIFVAVLFGKHLKNHGDPTLSSPISYKFRYYRPNVWGQMAKYFLVLASIDRFAMTSANVHLRAFSRPTTARYLVSAITVFCHLVASERTFLGQEALRKEIIKLPTQ